MRIPYQKQDSAKGDRRCGAAAMAMVYASLDLHVRQDEIWERIAGPSTGGGTRPGRTHLLARDALDRGLAAVVIQTLRPWDLLRACWDGGVRAVLNHRLRPESPSGHYSVLAGIDAERAVLHDPQWGPARVWTRQDLLHLWLPTAGGCEIAGQVLVAIAARETEVASCCVCQAPMPAAVRCIGCRRSFPLRPAAALGCLQQPCEARLWKYLFCPYCDAAMSEAVLD